MGLLLSCDRQGARSPSFHTESHVPTCHSSYTVWPRDLRKSAHSRGYQHSHWGTARQIPQFSAPKSGGHSNSCDRPFAAVDSTGLLHYTQIQDGFSFLRQIYHGHSGSPRPLTTASVVELAIVIALHGRGIPVIQPNGFESYSQLQDGNYRWSDVQRANTMMPGLRFSHQ